LEEKRKTGKSLSHSMYSSFQLTRKYLSYYWHASNGKGHGVHSPFVFNFINKVLNDRSVDPSFIKIEKERTRLLKDTSVIEVNDFGAGSAVIPYKNRVVKNIASSSLKNKKFARLFYRMVKYYKPKTIIDIGTSFGTTTAYLATAQPSSKVFTLEGSENIAAIAAKTFSNLELKNVHLIKANFDEQLPALLQTIDDIDFCLVDGNHSEYPTLQYFDWLLKKTHPNSIIIFDDIHWSEGMEQAWARIKANPEVRLSIDLFFAGVVFFKEDFKHKQHFTLRF
jgi:predicted O-methyltransferase YrrM